ncbi:MFS transporter [Arthrobacter sp. 24S4-2]|uniref:MFS transporter n=1 Tax=Arthrobacter sp. 24S4-2 TaxID=2575374 RepID=UPI001C2F7199|nr:MFS transporter [Arthrobacter sp. 24S4-2]
MSSANQQSSLQHTAIRQKPLMNMRQILLMNVGFFGIQYSFGMQQTAINPVYEFLGANPADLPILNLAGPITGLLIQPLIGALSDRTWSPRWGRRKPFFLIGAIGCALCLFLFPFVTAVWMAVMLLWLLDASNNTAMEPYRAFIADKLPPPSSVRASSPRHSSPALASRSRISPCSSSRS